MPRVCCAGELDQLRKRLWSRRTSDRYLVVCCGSGCRTRVGEKVAEALHNALSREAVPSVGIRMTGCYGPCSEGAFVSVLPEGIRYAGVRPDDAQELVTRTLLDGDIVERLLYVGATWSGEGQFFADDLQWCYSRGLLRYNAGLDPTEIEDYVALGGYGTLARVLTRMAPSDVIEVVRESGLFESADPDNLTGGSWENARYQSTQPRHLAATVECDDLDASQLLLEGNPHCVFEGLLIGAHAMCAVEGRIRLPRTARHLRRRAAVALRQARQYGLVGANVLGTGLRFEVEIDDTTAQPQPRQTRPICTSTAATWACIPYVLQSARAWYRERRVEVPTGEAR